MGRGCLSHFQQGSDYLMERDQKNYKDLLSVAEYFVDLFLFIPPFQLICWPLTAILKTGPSSYVFLLKYLEDAVLLVTSS